MTEPLFLKAIEPIPYQKTETASWVRGRTEAVLDFAKTRRYRSGENPAAWEGNLVHVLPARATIAKVEHHASLAYSELPDFMDRIDAVVRIPPMRRELLGHDLKREYEDLAIMLILKNFPDVKFIGKWALETICEALAPPNSMRRAEKMIFSSTVQESENFDLQCIPKQFRRRGGASGGELEPA